MQHRKLNLIEALSTNLEFRIPTINPNLVQQFGDIFELARSECEYFLESWLGGMNLGGGDSETSVVLADGGWLKIISLTCGNVITYLNQRDSSSVVRCSPDVTQYLNGAMFLKVEQKASQMDLLTARLEILSKFNKDACCVFPRGHQSIICMASAGGLIDMLEVSYAENGYYGNLLHSFNLTTLQGKVNFLVSLMKFLRFVITIDGPNESFHLIPGVRRETPNQHHVTWIREGILKEYKTLQLPKQMEVIKAIYNAQLPHVEHGVVQNIECQTALITRVGRQLHDCIRKKIVTKEIAIDHITLAIGQLHAINLAHCDICVNNCYVDLSGRNPIVFLNDLEYARPLDAAPPQPPHNSRLPPGHALPSTAEELDFLQLKSFKIEISKLY